MTLIISFEGQPRCLAAQPQEQFGIHVQRCKLPNRNGCLGWFADALSYAITGYMPEISRTTATLRIFGDDLDPLEVTRVLGTEPTDSTRKGEARYVSSGTTVVARSGSWRLKAAASIPGDLNIQIKALLAEVTDDLFVWRKLSRRYQCDIFCGLFMDVANEGEQLEPETIEILSSRGLMLGLDIYGPGD